MYDDKNNQTCNMRLSEPSLPCSKLKQNGVIEPKFETLNYSDFKDNVLDKGRRINRFDKLMR